MATEWKQHFTEEGIIILTRTFHSAMFIQNQYNTKLTVNYRRGLFKKNNNNNENVSCKVIFRFIIAHVTENRVVYALSCVQSIIQKCRQILIFNVSTLSQNVAVFEKLMKTTKPCLSNSGMYIFSIFITGDNTSTVIIVVAVCLTPKHPLHFPQIMTQANTKLLQKLLLRLIFISQFWGSNFKFFAGSRVDYGLYSYYSRIIEEFH